jgi:general secretion pathway protein D
MKTLLTALVLVLTSLELWAQTPGLTTPPATRRSPRIGDTTAGLTPPLYPTPGTPGSSSPATPAAATGKAPADPQANELQPMINWQGVDLNQVLEIYAKYVGRTLIRANLPEAKIILKTETPLTRTETIQAIQAVLALNNISVITIGEKFVKVLASDQANAAGAELDRSGATNLPNMGSYITHITQLKYVKPTVMMQLITPFSKLPNSVFPIDDNGILVIRDYAENVKRMLEMIEQVDVSVPTEYISEVIPIRYAKVDEIASALNSLGGSGGGATVSIGGSTSGGQISGFSGGRTSAMGGGMGGGMGGMGGIGGNNYQSGGMGGGTSAFGGNRTGMGGIGGTAANPNGTPTGGSTFASRLNNIINRASSPTGGGGGGQDQIQLFGQTKIIPNESSSSLLVFATRQDMAMITNIIAKLDVPLAQVLIEAIIMDVTLGNTFNFGVSAAQNPTALSPGGSVIGGGGVNNGNSFMHFLQTLTTNYLNPTSSVISGITRSIASSGGTNATFGNNLAGGFSYFGSIGPTWDVAVKAAETDDHASIIQRPRIQTSQAKAAQFFVGETVPYVTSTYGSGYGGGYGGSSYSQLSVGVELDVTPYINPDGLVVMDIQQEYDEISGSTTIAGVGDIPNTIKRTLNTEIAVRDRDTIMLGGFIKSNKSHGQSGVPFLSDIPILGNLFKQRTDKKAREELIVLMRPTVLKTPELAAKHTIKEEQRLPGISAAAAEDAEYERKLIDDERKREKKKFGKTKQYDGFFNPEPDDSTNAPAPLNSTAPQTSNEPPSATMDSAAAQERAHAAFAQKMMELDAPTNSAP